MMENNIYGTNANLADTDGDGFHDGIEVSAGTDPLSATDFPIPSVSDDSSHL